jgi:hypothetical protein
LVKAKELVTEMKNKGIHHGPLKDNGRMQYVSLGIGTGENPDLR